MSENSKVNYEIIAKPDNRFDVMAKGKNWRHMQCL